MQIIKEVVPSNGQNKARCVIRTNSYGSTFAFLTELFQIAKADFPALDADDVEVVKFAGERYAKTFGLEFAPPSDVPETYRQIGMLEYLL